MKRLFAFCAAVVVATAIAVPASARQEGRGGGREDRPARAAQTKLRFKLDDHSWESGATVTGTASLRSGRGRGEPVEGATLNIVLENKGVEADGEECFVEDGSECFVDDGGDCASVTTDADGKATISCAGLADGHYVMRVLYAGDEQHKRAKRAQGFSIGASDDDEDGEDEVQPTPTPTPESTPTI